MSNGCHCPMVTPLSASVISSDSCCACANEEASTGRTVSQKTYLRKDLCSDDPGAIGCAASFILSQILPPGPLHVKRKIRQTQKEFVFCRCCSSLIIDNKLSLRGYRPAQTCTPAEIQTGQTHRPPGLSGQRLPARPRPAT